MKTYIKPELFYERYEVSQHIADCQWELKSHAAIESCKAHPDEAFWGPGYTETLATADLNCDITNIQDYCYQNGSDVYKKYQFF